MAFWKPGTVERVSTAKGDFSLLVNNRHSHLPLHQQSQFLPIYRCKNHILFALEKFTAMVLTGETGSGKSTQIPLYLHEAGWTSTGNKIVCTQPRRIAATSIAARVAEELGCVLGEEVGYSVRFDSKCSSRTVIKYVTDGLLIRETLSDPLLSSYSVIMVDEAHERSLETDILLGLLKKIKRKRPELRIIVTSATLNAALLKDFFESNTEPENPEKDTACILSIQGRLHSVDVLYLEKPANNYIRSSVDTVLEIHNKEDWGDILVFLPGGEEVDTAISLLNELYSGKHMLICPLYGTLPVSVQMAVFQPTPAGHRKVVFATNIAETSITIEGIKFVVDAGFVKLNYFNVESGVDALVTTSISQASGQQRAGRAGRTQQGKCFRLCTEDAFFALPEFTPPQMQRTDISWAVLQLKALGINDVLHFDFLSPPPAESMIHALELLFSLGGLDIEGKLTTLGEQMAECPIEPRLAKSLISSFDFGCTEEILSIAAMCAVEYPFINMRTRASQEAKKRFLECVSEFAVLEGDHLTLLNIYNAFVDNNCDASWCDSMCLQFRVLTRAKEVRGHLAKMLKRFAPDGEVCASCGEDTVSIRKALVAGYFANTAKLHSDGSYRTVRGNVMVSPSPSSIYQSFGTLPEWVIYNDVLHTKTTQIRELTKIDPRWLLELAEHYYSVDNRAFRR